MGILDDILSGGGSGGGGGSVWGDIGSVLNPLLQAGTQIWSVSQASKVAKQQARGAMAGGGMGLPSLPTIGTGAMAFPAIPASYRGGVVNAQYSTPTPVESSTVAGALSSKYPREVAYGDHIYVNRGRALLYSGDLAACKRVAKIARRAHRAIGSRRPR